MTQIGNGEPRLFLYPTVHHVDVLGSVYRLALNCTGDVPERGGTHLLGEVERLADAVEQVESEPEELWFEPAPDGPTAEPGDMVVIRGSYEKYRAGPAGLPALPAGDLVRELGHMGVDLDPDDDEVEWVLGTACAEVWLERGPTQEIVALVLHLYDDRSTEPEDERELLTGVLALTRDLGACAWVVDEDAAVPLAV